MPTIFGFKTTAKQRCLSLHRLSHPRGPSPPSSRGSVTLPCGIPFFVCIFFFFNYHCLSATVFLAAPEPRRAEAAAGVS